MKIRGRARVRVKGDAVGGDKIVQGDEINAGGDANVVKVGAGATMGDIIFDGKRKPKPEELAAAKREYLEFVIRANQDVKPPSVIDAQNRVTLQLDEIYIPVTITFKELRAETDKKDKKDKSQEEPPKRIELAQIVRDSPRAVLLGEPGAGKTTILRYLALHFAKTLREHPDYGVNVRDGDTDFGAARLPIFIRLATFASAKRTWREYILDAFSDVSAPKEAVDQVLTEALSQGKALILLDGLDEVLDNRAHVIDQIESFDAGLQGRNQIIVTSRRSSYGRALGGAFKAFDLNELEQEQIAKFLEFWNLAIEKKRIQENGETFQTELARERAVKERAQEQFTKIAEKLETNLGAQNLAKNPLTLRMLAEAYRWSGGLPNRRVALYNLIVKQSLEFWETQVAQIPKGRNVSRREAITRLAPLAYWMHLENESPSEDQITKRLGEILALKLKLEPAHPDVENAVEDFWTRAKERTGLFVQDTPNHFRFVHATFREYFAGLYLVQDRAQAAQRIYSHRHQPRWEEPILLGIAHASTDDPKFASDLIRTAILAEGEESARLGFERSRYEDVLHRDLLFAVRCLIECNDLEEEFASQLLGQLIQVYTNAKNNDPLTDRIGSIFLLLNQSAISKSIKDWVFSASGYSANRFDSDETLHEVVFSSRNLEWLKYYSISSYRVSGVLIKALHSQDPEVRGKAAKWLGELSPTTEVVAGLVATMSDENNGVREDAIKALGNLASVTRQAAVELTRIALEDNSYIYAEAATALGQLKSNLSDISLMLTTALKSDDSYLQQRAAWVTGEFRQATPELITTLVEILQDDGEWIDQQLARWCQGLEYLDMNMRVRLAQDFLVWRRRLKAQGIEVTGDSLLGLTLHMSQDERAEMQIATQMFTEQGYRYEEAEFSLGILGQWTARNRDLRAKAAEALGKLGNNSPKMVTALQKTLKDADRYVRWYAAEALVQLESYTPELANCLIELAQNKDNKNSGMAWMPIRAMGKLRNSSPEVISALIEITKDKASRDRDDAVVALGQLGVTTSEVVETLMSLLKDFDGDVSYTVARVLGRMASTKQEILKELAQTLNVVPENKRRYLDWEAWGAFVLSDTPIVHSTLLTILNNPAAEIHLRCRAATDLARAAKDAPEIVQGLIAALQDEHAELRESAASALLSSELWSVGYNPLPGRIKQLENLSRDEVEIILRSAQDEDVKARSAGLGLLVRLEELHPRIMPLLLAAIQDENKEIRRSAIWVLARLKTVTPEILTTLLDHIRGEDEDVRQHAIWGLGVLDLDVDGRNWKGFSRVQITQIGNQLFVELKNSQNEDIYDNLWHALNAINQISIKQSY